MSITLPTLSDLRQQGNSELRRRIPSIDPTVDSSFSRTFIEAVAANAFSLVQVIRDEEEQLFPQTSDGEFLDRWAGYEGMTRLVSSSSSGLVAHEGTVGTLIPTSTEYISASGVTFVSTTAATVVNSGLSVASISRVGTVATVETSSDHNYGSGVTVTVSGANEASYNGNFEITVISRTTFTYEVLGSPSTPATGTISSTTTLANVNVQSLTTGADVNVDANGVLTLVDEIANISTEAIATIDGLTGGASEETDTALRERVLLSRSIIQGVFTADQVKLAALGVNGNTRVFVITPDLRSDGPVVNPGDLPAPGQVVVYVLRDNDANIIPSQTVLNNTKDAIIENGKMPANTSENDIFVFAPDAVDVDFDFASLSPDTATMRTAIQDQLQAFFEDQVEFQEDITQADYLGAINNTQDLQTNTFLESFSLNSPTGDITINDGEIGVLGNVTFP
ncbi:MAG: hypothetical protein GY746_00170 [Gammaproteobacteria bacterium]|nr:hypothetical protein [Gammaproteobacteria bacterium]MCP4488151.1 hypothetical protein [Gammaproteobacteria bacterium]